MIDEVAFLDTINDPLFGGKLAPKQHLGLFAILDACDAANLDNRHTAYILATAYHETGPSSRMVPNRENMNYTTAKRLTQVWPKRFPTEASAKGFVKNPKALANKVYNGRLGNRTGTDDGFIFRGGGFDHLTGRENYERASVVLGFDLTLDPDRLLEPKVAAKVMVSGMISGRYTGKKLSSFIVDQDPPDYRGARAVVNGDVKANGEAIAQIAFAFLTALEAAGRQAMPKVDEKAIDMAVKEALKGRANPMEPVELAPRSGALWTLFLELIKWLFGGRKRNG